MGQENICGFNIEETTCSEISIKQINYIEYQMMLIDEIITRLESVEKPKIGVGFFDDIENAGMNITIKPTSINQVDPKDPNHQWGFQVLFRSSNQIVRKAYSEILWMLTIFVNIVGQFAATKNLTYSGNFAITNSGNATLTLTLSKRLDAYPTSH